MKRWLGSQTGDCYCRILFEGGVLQYWELAFNKSSVQMFFAIIFPTTPCAYKGKSLNSKKPRKPKKPIFQGTFQDTNSHPNVSQKIGFLGFLGFFEVFGYTAFYARDCVSESWTAYPQILESFIPESWNPYYPYIIPGNLIPES